MVWHRLALATLALAVLVAACSDGDSESSTTTTTTTVAAAPSTTTSPTTEPESDEPIGGFVPTLSPWSGNMSMLTVPLDHDDPTGPTVEVPVARAEATDPDKRIGVLLVNPGGPGYPASPLAIFADQVFTAELRERFDIVALDPRGTFPDTAVNCFVDLAAQWASVDYSPDAPGELQALDESVQAWVDRCEAQYGDLLPHVSTMDTVHDMAMLVSALGEEQVSYFGFSYGTALGSAFATTYPELVRAAILDSAYLATADLLDSMLDSFSAMDDLLVRVFAECDADPECPITGGAQQAFTELAARADADPITGNRLLPTINEQSFAAAIRFSEVAYGGSADPLLLAVADANDGQYFRLQSLIADAAALLEAGGSALAISCMDSPYRDQVPLPDDAIERLTAVATTYASVFPIPEGFDPFAVLDECARWPAGPDLLPDPLSAAGAGPILVVAATEDPVTPLASAERLAAELVNGALLVVDSPVHGLYQIDIPIRTEARRCATEYMDRFLIDLVAPEDGTFCAEG
ncbi:MAG: alpha/beta fold hydrolase [Acidimicrobiia bacterium]|nr:alpha/beta fold hydrolase [Acidimicrobiia bacterium]